MRKAFIILLSSALAAILLTIAYLEIGTWTAPLVAGAAASLLGTSLWSKFSSHIHGEESSERDAIYQLALVALTAILTFAFITTVQTQSVITQKITSESLVENSGRYYMNDVAYDGDRLVGGGWYRLGDTDDYLDAAIWTSTDGWSWPAVPKHLNGDYFGGIQTDQGHVAQRLINGVTALDDHSILLVGFDTAPDNVKRGKAWRLPRGEDTVQLAPDIVLPDAEEYLSYAHHGGDEVLSGIDDGNAVVWIRSDKGDWKATSFGSWPEVSIEKAVHEGGKWFLVGWDRSTDPGFADDPDYYYARDALLLVADDNFNWKKVPSLAGITGSQVINDVVYLKDTWLAIGEDDGGNNTKMDAAIWRSNTGDEWEPVGDRSLAGAGGWQFMTAAVIHPRSERITVVGGQIPGKDRVDPVPPATAKTQWTNDAWEITLKPSQGVRWTAFYDWIPFI